MNLKKFKTALTVALIASSFASNAQVETFDSESDVSVVKTEQTNILDVELSPRELSRREIVELIAATTTKLEEMKQKIEGEEGSSSVSNDFTKEISNLAAKIEKQNMLLGDEYLVAGLALTGFGKEFAGMQLPSRFEGGYGYEGGIAVFLTDKGDGQNGFKFTPIGNPKLIANIEVGRSGGVDGGNIALRRADNDRFDNNAIQIIYIRKGDDVQKYKTIDVIDNFFVGGGVRMKGKEVAGGVDKIKGANVTVAFDGDLTDLDSYTSVEGFQKTFYPKVVKIDIPFGEGRMLREWQPSFSVQRILPLMSNDGIGYTGEEAFYGTLEFFTGIIPGVSTLLDSITGEDE